MNRDFKGVWIPKEIWLSTDLKVMEKLILVEIDSLDNEEGCFASNEHFSKFFSLSKNRCSELIKSLEQKGYIDINYVYQQESKAIAKRVIRCVRNFDGGIRKTDRPIRNIDRGVRKIEEGYSENCEDNNTLIINTINNTREKENNVVQSTPVSSDGILVDEIIRYLNLKTNKNFRTTTKAYRKEILGRLNDKESNYRPEDFKYVIDVKCAEWLGTDMEKHLNPTTLFRAGNFDRYLNQQMPQQQNKKTLRNLASTGQIDLSDVL